MFCICKHEYTYVLYYGIFRIIKIISVRFFRHVLQQGDSKLEDMGNSTQRATKFQKVNINRSQVI